MWIAHANEYGDNLSTQPGVLSLKIKSPRVGIIPIFCLKPYCLYHFYPLNIKERKHCQIDLQDLEDLDQDYVD